MRKEVILAVIIGVLLGGVILYGINLANNASKDTTSEETIESTTKATPTPTKSNNLISIAIPLDNSVVTESVVSLKGTTKPNLNIAIISENDDLLTTSDKTGSFSANINLINGENKITVTIVDEKQATSSSSITIIKVATLPE